MIPENAEHGLRRSRCLPDVDNHVVESHLDATTTGKPFYTSFMPRGFSSSNTCRTLSPPIFSSHEWYTRAERLHTHLELSTLRVALITGAMAVSCLFI